MRDIREDLTQIATRLDDRGKPELAEKCRVMAEALDRLHVSVADLWCALDKIDDEDACS